MKSSTKKIATILMASIQSAAFAQPILVSSDDLINFEKKAQSAGLSQELLKSNILIPTNKSGILVLNVDAVKKIEDEAALKILSNLVKFVTEGKVDIESKDWKDMTLSTQDYKM